MTTAVEISNAALNALGGTPIQALPERGTMRPDPVEDPDAFTAFALRFSQTALMAGATYYIHRDALLASYPWSWARRRVQLDERTATAEEAQGAAPLYRYTFWLPAGADALGVGARAIYRRKDDQRPQVRGWARYGRQGITADYRPLWADYIEDVGEEQWPPLVVKALELKLAQEWAYFVTDQANLKRDYAAEYKMAFREAKRVDAQSEPSKRVHDLPLINARFAGGYSDRLERTVGGGPTEVNDFAFNRQARLRQSGNG